MIKQLKSIFNQHLALSIIFLIAIVVYFKLLFYGHISWDDPEMIFRNKDVQSFNLKGFFSKHYVGNYIPVTMFVHSLTWAVFGENESGHHLLNILLHLLNGFLVFRLSEAIFKRQIISVIAYAIFLLHPLQVESVAWISELKNLLSGTFYLLALLAYISFKEQNKRTHYFACLLFFILGALSKSSVVMLPLVLVVYDIYSTGHFELKSLANKVPLLLISIAVGVINLKTQLADQFINYSHAFPFPQRTGFAGFALLKYLLLFIAPANMSIIYPYPEIKAAILATGGIFLFVVIALLVVFIIKKKYTWLFVIAFILFNLILVLQFIPFGEVLYADRYMYIPIIGFGWIIALLLGRIRMNQLVIPFAVAVILAVLTFGRIGVWKSAISLYEDILKKYPDNFVALNSAGVESMFLNNDEKSLEYFNRAIKAGPRNYKGYYNRGLLYIKNNKPGQAIKSFNKTIELYEYPKAYVGRATAYYMLADFPKAINDATRALSLEPANVKAHLILGNCYNDMNQLEASLREYNKCIELNPAEAECFFKRAIVYGKKQDFNGCIADLDLALSLNKNLIEAYYWRGVAKVNLKLNPCEDFRMAAQNNFEPAVNAFNKFCQ